MAQIRYIDEYWLRQTSDKRVERCFDADLSTGVLETIRWKTEAYKCNSQVSRKRIFQIKSSVKQKFSLYLFFLSRYIVISNFLVSRSVGRSVRRSAVRLIFRSAWFILSAIPSCLTVCSLYLSLCLYTVESVSVCLHSLCFVFYLPCLPA